VMESVEALKDRHGIYRFCNDHQLVIVRKPG